LIGRAFSARVFTLSFGAGYAFAVHFSYPLFRYFPLTKHLSFHGDVTASSDPVMSWYGWIGTAAIFAAFSTALVPRRIGERIPERAVWLVVLIMLAAAVYREGHYFLPPP
jgi:hypothetical protein